MAQVAPRRLREATGAHAGAIEAIELRSDQVESMEQGDVSAREGADAVEETTNSDVMHCTRAW